VLSGDEAVEDKTVVVRTLVVDLDGDRIAAVRT
jgi:hypothetical protein